MKAGDLVCVRNPPFDAGKLAIVVEVRNTPYGWSSLVLLTNGEYYETNTLHCELMEEPQNDVNKRKKPRDSTDGRAY